MTPQQYQRMKAIFFEACEQPPQEQERSIAVACGSDPEVHAEVVRLLEQDRSASGVDPARLRAQLAAVVEEDGRVSIGKFRIIRRIGTGGMGVVYEADQGTPRRTVALKVIAGGAAATEGLDRFRHEVDLLGRLQHPGIAQIYEAGTFESALGPQPYFAMELVKGQPLLDYAAGRGLGLRQRLALFAMICDAVEHAHQKGVIHRDLKPANILVVDEPSGSLPKILDFGVARATDTDLRRASAATRSGALVGTLSYMSPEQARGASDEIDTRSDVYALGVVLYQLLTGAFPYDVDGPIPDVVAAIASHEPTRPSAVNPQLDDDVDTILLKCLAKDPRRRYQTATELARDVRHHLAGDPIEARRDSRPYVIRKALQRHWAAATIAAAFVTLISAGLVVSVALWRTTAAALSEARWQEGRAIAEGDKARAVNDFLGEMLMFASPEVSGGREVSMVEALDDAARLLDAGRFADQAEVEASIRMTLGHAYRTLGKLNPAAHHLEQALALRRSVFAGDQRETAQSLLALGLLRRQQDDLAEAEALARVGYEMMQRVAPGDDLDTAQAAQGLAMIEHERGRQEQAEALAREAVEMIRRLPGDHQPQLASALAQLAGILQSSGEIDEAERAIREALATARASLGETSAEAIRLLRELASILHLKREYGAAEAAYLELIELRRQVYGPRHPMLLADLGSLAYLYGHMGETEQGLQTYDELLPMVREVHGADSARHGEMLLEHATMLARAGDDQSAEHLFREALGILDRIGEERSIEAAVGRVRLAALTLRRGDLAETKAICENVLARDQQSLPPAHWSRGQAHSLLGEVLTRSGAFPEAERELLAGYELLVASRIRGPYVGAAIERLASLYESWEAADPAAGRAGAAATWRQRLAERR